jgi:hypothetical protein
MGGHAVSVYRVDNTTVGLRTLTDAGSYPVFVSMGSDTATLGPVTLHGYVGETQGPVMSGRAARVNPDSSGDPIVFASGDSGGILLDLTTNTVAGTIPDSITSPDCAMSPGASYRGAGYFTLQGKKGGTCQNAMSWQVYPRLAIADSISPISNALQWYVMAEVGPKHWFEDNNNHTYAFDCSGASCAQKFWLEGSGPNGVMIDPTGQRFTWTGQDIHGAVLSTATFDTAFALPTSTAMKGSAFSSGGDTLFFHGALYPQSYAEFVGAARVSDGTVVRRLSVDSMGLGSGQSVYGDVAVDPVNPWLYVLTGFGASTNSYGLVVVDRGSWTVVGVAMIPWSSISAEAADDIPYNAAAVMPDPAHHRVYVVATDYMYNVHGHHGAILTFETP